jgi:hypothetical protein
MTIKEIIIAATALFFFVFILLTVFKTKNPLMAINSNIEMLIIDKFLINSMASMEFVYFTAATMFIFGLPNLDVAGFNNKDDTVITMTKKRAEVLDAWHRPYKISKVVMQYITLCPYPNE